MTPARRLATVATFAVAAFAPTALAAFTPSPNSSGEVTGWPLAFLVLALLLFLPMAIELSLVQHLGPRYWSAGSRSGRLMPILIAVIACASWFPASAAISERLVAISRRSEAVESWFWPTLLLLGWLFVFFLLWATLRRLRALPPNPSFKRTRQKRRAA